MPFPVLQNNGWFPSGRPWTWYTGGYGTGGAVGIDVSLGYEGGNHSTFCIIVGYDTQPWTWASDLLGTNIAKPQYTGLSTQENGNEVNGSPVITALTSTNGLIPGQPVTGTGIPASTTILSVDSPTQITLTNNATATATNLLTFALAPVTNSQLSRVAPMQHPLAPHLYCNRIVSAKPFSGMTKASFPSGFVGPLYNYWLLTLDFTQPKWNRTLSDSDFYRIFGANAGEWNRFTTLLYRPSMEVIQRLAGTFKWNEGGGAGQPTVGNAFNSPWPQILAKAEVVLIWHRVPKFKGLFSTAKVRPENIDAAIGKLNNATFLGYPAGTLRLNPPEFIELEDPVPWFTLGINPAQGQTSIMCDVVFPFSYWDPPNGGATHGHNLAPWGDGQNKGDGNWYQIVMDTANAAATTPLQSTDMSKVFQLPT